MKVMISPAKKMRVDRDSMPYRDLPVFLDRAEEIYRHLQAMSAQELQALWRCNDRIAQLNLERLRTHDLRHALTPAILAYDGIQYQYMAPGVFTQGEFDYIQDHVRILSGLYGVLRPFDGVIPYRLEMQASLKICGAKDLYYYWGKVIAEELYRDTDCVINLASKEYSRCVSPYLKPGRRMITVVFGEKRDGRIVEKGTQCKMARGEMVRFLAQCRGEDPEQLQGFSQLHYAFSPEDSNQDVYTFLLSLPKGGGTEGNSGKAAQNDA